MISDSEPQGDGADRIAVSPSFTPRKNYGARLEPEDGVLHGAGQCEAAFGIYCDLLRETACLPLLYMTYLSAKAPPEKMKSWVSGLAKSLGHFPEIPLMPQIGLSMTRDGTPEAHYEGEVAAGKYDENLKTLFSELAEEGRSFYLRIGYECNGPWNGYEPSAYRDAYGRVADLLRESGAAAANVWCVEPYEIEKTMAWYPGDDVVDWWSVDWFDPEHMPASSDFLGEADLRAKPVMIGESSPRRLGTEDAAARWAKWYAPYFEAVRRSPGIKAFCYINWNWAGRMAQWADWGDSRLEADPLLVDRWREEMSCPLYVHA